MSRFTNWLFDGGEVRFFGAAAVLILVIVLIGAGVDYATRNRLRSGVVVQKICKPAENRTGVTSRGDVYTYAAPEEYILRVKGEWKGKTRVEDWPVTSINFAQFNIGDEVYP